VKPCAVSSYFESVLSEDLISLKEAAKILPPRRGGKRPSLSCMFRWASRGVCGVVLETWSLGGGRVTSKQALARFLERVTQARRQDTNKQAVVAHTETIRRARSERAGAVLDALGFRPSRSGEVTR